jgi:hypothetical protein
MKRQRGRNRGGSSGSGGGGKPQQNVNRAFESNGPDNVKIRGNAQHVFEKYQQLARDATAAGDRVLGENYLQHAEHYFRVVRAVSPNRSASEILGRDALASGFDIDFEDESGAQAGEDSSSDGGEGESQGESGEQRGERQDRDWQPRQDRSYNQDRPQGDRSRDDRNYNQDRPRDDRGYNQDRPRDERAQGERSQGERSQGDRPRDERPRGDRPRGDRFRDRDRDSNRDRPRDPMAVVEPESTPLTTPAPQSTSMPEVDDGPRLRSQDGSVSHAPAFLQARPERTPEADSDVEARKPRRRRAPRSFEGGEGEAPAAPETEEA